MAEVMVNGAKRARKARYVRGKFTMVRVLDELCVWMLVISLFRGYSDVEEEMRCQEGARMGYRRLGIEEQKVRSLVALPGR